MKDHDKYTSQEWYAHAKFLYEIISNEIDNSIADKITESYPRAVVAYEFFRLLRGEWLYSLHPLGMAPEGLQKDIYRMENELYAKLETFRKTINPNDEKIVFYVNEMKKTFDLKKD